MELRLATHKQFGAFSLDLDLVIQGEACGIFGPSGSGKSTLVSLVAGLLRPDRGSILLDGTPLFDGGSRVDVPPDRRRIGIVFQQPSLFPHLNVLGNLLYGFKRCAPEHRRIDLDSLVRVLHLAPLLDRGVNNLSGGERQRVAIGRTVLSNPRLLLMDEPLSALDDHLRFQIISHLKTVCREFHLPFLFISHSMLEMRLMTDQVIALAGGRVVAQTTTERLARERMGLSPVGYINLLRLEDMRVEGGASVYRWEGGELVLPKGEASGGLFELSSKDIILFKRHPEAISARNLLECTVVAVFESGSRLGVELASGGGRLIAEIVPAAAQDLEIVPGSTLFAAIKASAFRRLAVPEPGESLPETEPAG
jgi:molybdate transport system ATP-binding protein